MKRRAKKLTVTDMLNRESERKLLKAQSRLHLPVLHSPRGSLVGQHRRTGITKRSHWGPLDVASLRKSRGLS